MIRAALLHEQTDQAISRIISRLLVSLTLKSPRSQADDEHCKHTAWLRKRFLDLGNGKQALKRVQDDYACPLDQNSNLPTMPSCSPVFTRICPWTFLPFASGTLVVESHVEAITDHEKALKCCMICPCGLGQNSNLPTRLGSHPTMTMCFSFAAYVQSQELKQTRKFS
jgi:hypothetical protein